MARLNLILTKILPFKIWSIVKPQKKNADYFFDDQNNLLTDLVGKTESLDEGLLSICRLIGIPLDGERIPVKNSSSHSKVKTYFSNRFHRKLYSKLIERDFKLYDQYKERITTEKYNLKNTLIYD
jgi:hypothetical protein